MAIRMKCQCGKALVADDKYAGRRGKCPACGAPVMLPAAAAPRGIEKAPPAPPAMQNIAPPPEVPPVALPRAIPMALPIADVMPVRQLAIVDRLPLWRRPVSGILGRMWMPLYAAVMGSMAFFRAGPKRGDWPVEQVAAGFLHANTADDLELQLGSSRPLRNIERIWRRRGIGVFGKVVGTLAWSSSEMDKALTRSDCYDPWAHTVVLFHCDPAILSHELGHARDFGRRKRKTLYALARTLPPVALYQEYLASRFGVERLRETALDHQVRRANRVLGGGFGTYVGYFLGGMIYPLIVVVAGLLGQLIGRLAQPFGRSYAVAAGAAPVGPNVPQA